MNAGEFFSGPYSTCFTKIVSFWIISLASKQAKRTMLVQKVGYPAENVAVVIIFGVRNVTLDYWLKRTMSLLIKRYLLF